MQDDNLLMQQAQNGDKDSFETLILRYRYPATSFAHNMVGDWYLAEDLVQDSFVKLYCNREAYRPTYCFSTYFYTILRNRCIDTLRARSKHEAFGLEEQVLFSPDTLPEEYLLQKERYERLNTAFSKLPLEQRTALYLFAVEERSYGEIAQILQKSLPQLKILLHRARKKLKSNLEGGTNDAI